MRGSESQGTALPGKRFSVALIPFESSPSGPPEDILAACLFARLTRGVARIPRIGRRLFAAGIVIDRRGADYVAVIARIILG